MAELVNAFNVFPTNAFLLTFWYDPLFGC